MNKMIINLMKRTVSLPIIAFGRFGNSRVSHCIPDNLHLKCAYWVYMHRRLNLANPMGFNEKLQWLKIHDRNSLYTTLVDKYRVKQWVAQRIGVEHVTPTYAMWERVEDIDISDLPERFVLKTNHDCGGVAICRNRATFDLDAAKKKLAKHLKTNYFWRTREWPYKNVKPCVFAEEYIDPDESNDLCDYKVFCFGGKADCVMLCVDRATGNTKYYFLDKGWSVKPYNKRGLSLPEGFTLPKPDGIDEVFDLAEKLAVGIPFVRADFYVVNGNPVFGEMTFYPQGGFDANLTRLGDERWGSMLRLPCCRDGIGQG